MRDFVVFAWPPNDPLAAINMDGVRRRLSHQPSWRLIEAEPGLALALQGPRQLAVRAIKGRVGWVLGDLYDQRTFQPAPDQITLREQDDLSAKTLIEQFWGRYVAVWRSDPELAVVRDPSGALEALRWRACGVEIVASCVPPAWMGGLAPVLQLDWDAVARGLLEPVLLQEEVALAGLTATPAGARSATNSPTKAPVRIWTPATVIRSAASRDVEIAPEGLARVVDGCVGAMAQTAGRMVAELSGGLDSSILASALRAREDASVVGWANVFARDRESDEREAARLVSGALDVRLTEILKPEFIFTEESLAQYPISLRPSQSALDHSHDEALATLCTSLGADSLVTGQGGDAAFLQAVTPLALLDQSLVRAGGWSAEALAIARGSRQSIWSVMRQAALAAVRMTPGRQAPPSRFLSGGVRGTRSAPVHPWLEELDGLSPAKRLHIRALAYAQVAHGDSRRGRCVDVIHPLLAQPIVDYCLSASVAQLTFGGRGRALARSAFASRLPAAIIQRRAKGDLTAHYGRAIARSLPVLRPYLLDGALADRGLLDRPALEQALTSDHLIWHGEYADILLLMVMETWVRHWLQPPDQVQRGAN